MKSLLDEIKEAVVKGDTEKAKEAATKALASGVPAKEILNALIAGMNEISKLFDDGEIFLPEVMLAADAMYAGLGVIEPELSRAGLSTKLGKVVIGTVEGDIHDIGKNIVKIMLQGAGFEVYDLGKDVPCENFVKKAKEIGADIIGVSALMTTTTPGQKKVVELVREEGLNVKVMVGGACTTREWAESIGAHYARNASEAVVVARQLVGR